MPPFPLFESQPCLCCEALLLWDIYQIIKLLLNFIGEVNSLTFIVAALLYIVNNNDSDDAVGSLFQV